MTSIYGYPAMLRVSKFEMFNDLFRRPMGQPLLCYSFGMLASIFYYEYDKRRQRGSQGYGSIVDIIGESRKNCIIANVVGSLMVVFLIFIRYSDYY